MPRNAPQLKVALEDQEKQFARCFATLRSAIAQRAFPGASIAVTHRGVLVASQGFGRFTFNPASPEVQADTVFDLASVTKVVATTAIAMLLYERAKLSLGGEAGQALPEFVSLSPKHLQADRRRVTIRMLLAHSSGLPAYEKLFQFASTREDLVRAALTAPLVAAPGTRVEYSDIGFIALGELLEKVAGMSLDQFAASEIFTPLEMTRTGFNPGAEMKSAIPPTQDERSFFGRIIQGEVNDENANVMGGVAAQAGIFAPAADVARLAECMLRGGSPVFQPGTVKLFTKREQAPAGTTRALGWDTPSPEGSSSGQFFSERSFGHLGYTGTSLWIDPEKHLSVTLLTNRTWPDRSSHAIRDVRPRVHNAVVEALETK